MQKTKVIKKSDIEQKWYLIDAKDVRLGKLATTCAKLLIGKGKTSRTHNMVSGDKVIVINAGKVDVFAKKLTKNKHVRHSTYRGGYREKTWQEVLETKPERLIEHAISGMLPKNKLHSDTLANLYIYAEADHQHEAQKPVKIEVK